MRVSIVFMGLAILLVAKIVALFIIGQGFETQAQALAVSKTPYTASCYAIDGDTLRCGEQRIRVLGIDAAELPGHCRAGRDCAPGDPWAQKRALAEFVADPVTIYPLKLDVYGRTVAIVRNSRGVNASCAMLNIGVIYRPNYDEGERIARECLHRRLYR